MRTAGPLVLALAAAGLVLPIQAQTPGQMEYERQQREYSRAQEQQRQEQQRLQQTMNENARRQQEESARAARGAATPPGTGGPAMSGGGPGGAQGAQLEQARRAWLKRPPLAPANNPLIGTWSRPASATARSQDPLAQLGAMMKGGLCEVLFSSDGLFEFKPTALVGIDKRTRRADVLDQLEYRGDAKRVVVIPKASFKLMVFDFNGPDRITWAGQNCTLQRVGAQAHAGSRR
jgi:hypothetical protein